MQPFEQEGGQQNDDGITSGSVLGGRRSPTNKDKKGNNEAIRYDNITEKTTNNIISAGKSLWGYFSAAADKVRGKETKN